MHPQSGDDTPNIYPISFIQLIMGSGQSSASGSFSIDPSGNISPLNGRTEAGESRNQTDSQPSDANNYPGQPTSETRDKGSESARESKQIEQHTQEQPASMQSNRQQENELSLQEADEITNRMKQKYKPKSAELAGKNRSAFEDIERDLAQCYKVNRDQPINCLQLTKDYNRMVEDHRIRILKRTIEVSPLK